MKALIHVYGAVQGVGYRPFVAELANEYKLRGEVKNLGGIVEITAIGDEACISDFADMLRHKSPAGSIVLKVTLSRICDAEPEGLDDCSGFRIVESGNDFKSQGLPVFPPDIGICPDCMREMSSANDRRYRYPLISCASCGPRYSILKRLPYDRETTTMEVFEMCESCASEYRAGRRRHAQTISCHDCGPQMIYRNIDKYKTHISDGSNTLSNEEIDRGYESQGEEAVSEAIKALKDGGIIGLKGTSGYQLVALPSINETVKKLRLIKGREQKPFAVMYNNIDEIGKSCRINEKEREYLLSAARPIVLLDKTESDTGFAENVCGASRQIGAFLPSVGIHSILTQSLGPLIVTSGNISGEPMIVSDEAFFKAFGDKVDGILYHKREILRPLDDSVLQIVKLSDEGLVPRFIRRARGYVPLPVFLSEELGEDTLFTAFGADLKNTFAIGEGDRIIPSQYLGDLESYETLKLQKNEFKSLLDIFTQGMTKKNIRVVSDYHPGYYSGELAADFAEKLRSDDVAYDSVTADKIQHHHAHVGSVMAEHGLRECIGAAFDGTGYGIDGNIWGSEFLICRDGAFDRVAHLKYITVVGQDESSKNAAISAACYLMSAGMDIPSDILDEGEAQLIKSAASLGINVHRSSSMGRIFDAVSCILGISSYNDYEGQCAVMLQNAAELYADSLSDINVAIAEITEFCEDNGICPEIITDCENHEDLARRNCRIIDTGKMIAAFMKHRQSVSSDKLAFAFHYILAQTLKRVFVELRNECGINNAALSGGTFTNRLLLMLCERFLSEEGFVVYFNGFVPTNDGGISTGQIYLSSLKTVSERN